MSYLKFDKTKLINLEYSLKRELLRTNRAGSYSCSTIVDCNTRKYHGLLVCPLPKLDGGRHVLLSTVDATIVQHDKLFNLGLHKYAGDNYEPKGHKYIRDLTSDPIPKLQYRVGGVVLSKEKILIENEERILIKYTLEEANSPTTIRFRPFLAFRNIHALSKSNMDVNTKYGDVANGIVSNLYHGYPNLFLQLSKKPEFVPAPDWYYDIEYTEEQQRGYPFKEDLYVPGYFEVPIKKGESIIFSAGLSEVNPKGLKQKYSREVNRRIPRDTYDNCLINSVNQFLVQSEANTYIMAGYPWLPIRSRDTFIALPGLLGSMQSIATYKKVLNTMIKSFNGHLINDLITENINKNQPADIPLWAIYCIQKLGSIDKKTDTWKTYGKFFKTVINGFLIETERFKVRDNGLIYNNNPNLANSWMDAHQNGQPILPRNGYNVETNGLWFNALKYVLEIIPDGKEKSWAKRLSDIAGKVTDNFENYFFLEEEGGLADYVTDEAVNNQVRPNQLIAVALPYSPLPKKRIKQVLDVTKQQLVTPYGIRSLSPIDVDYCPQYEGDHYEREFAAYNGSVWPWLFTFYIDGLLKVQPKAAKRVSEKFLKTIESEMHIHGICGISELYHGDPPQKPKGAISFALNTAELLRLKEIYHNIE